MYQLAQINVAQMKGKDINDPIMGDFVANIDRINQIAEASPGFVWRLKDEQNNALNINPFEDKSLLINISVWEHIAPLKSFVYGAMHLEIMQRKKMWFHHFKDFYYALWWVKKGTYPSLEEAAKKLTYLQVHGPTEKVFTFKKTYLPII